MLQGREIWVDWSKAILMYFVIVGHAGLPMHSMEWTLIFAFHMPAFFLISGYLYHPHTWKKTIKSLFYPVVFFSIINFIYISLKHAVSGDLLEIYSIVKLMRPLYAQSQDSDVMLFVGLWFIEVLFVCRCIVGDFTSKLSAILKHPILIALILIVYMTIEPYLNIPDTLRSLHVYKTLSCLPFVLIGFYVKQTNVLNIMKREMRWILLLVCIILYISISLRIGFVSIWSNDYGGNFLLFAINALASSFVVFTICMKLCYSKIVEVFSKGTLFILGAQFILIDLCNKFYRLLGIDNMLLPFATGLICMTICYLPISWCLKYWPKLLGK